MRKKVLYVDDEKSNLRIFKDSFRRDFDVYLAESGYDALKLLESTMVDLVITDQRMPEMTGVELLKEITEKYDSIPPNRLILSGYADDGEIEKAFKNFHLSKFISKPWNYNKLKETMIQALS
ncbi:response regulator [Plebeiibacterium sediminum]|uniref:Response regulator n=1 Tax=Plebeiibacterium sediminum TaxID=2992112 RepID=A0AAE3M2L8_9BACT|nr:response regulator [Plebeiobacterium sediminum]MCW3785634.1 response regulator [Plebeiobacterium sediminum]